MSKEMPYNLETDWIAYFATKRYLTEKYTYEQHKKNKSKRNDDDRFYPTDRDFIEFEAEIEDERKQLGLDNEDDDEEDDE